MSVCRRRAAVLWAGALALGARTAAADETEPIRVVFHAPAGCPDEAAFTGQVTARTRRARRADPGEPARTFTVSISAPGAKVLGKLTIDDPQGPASVRDVTGGTCEEVVSALALVSALAIDPRASTAPTPPPVPPPPPAPPPRPVEKHPPPPRYDMLPWWGPIGDPLPVIPAPVPEPGWALAWGLRFGGTGGVAPSLFFVRGGFAEVARRASAGVLAPAFRLGAFQGDSGLVPFFPGHFGRFVLTAARAEGCPVRLPLLPSLAAFPCVLFDAGRLDSIGQATVSAPPSAHPWVAPGLSARLRWEVLDRILVELEGGVNVPLVRDTFSFESPSGVPQRVHEVAPASGFFAAGVGTHFP